MEGLYNARGCMGGGEGRSRERKERGASVIKGGGNVERVDRHVKRHVQGNTHAGRHMQGNTCRETHAE